MHLCLETGDFVLPTAATVSGQMGTTSQNRTSSSFEENSKSIAEEDVLVISVGIKRRSLANKSYVFVW